MVVRMRRNRSQTAKRRSHHAIAAAKLAKCECGALKQPHRACASCGKYNGHVIIDVVAQTKKVQRRVSRREKELRESGHAAPSDKKEAAST